MQLLTSWMDPRIVSIPQSIIVIGLAPSLVTSPAPSDPRPPGVRMDPGCSWLAAIMSFLSGLVNCEYSHVNQGDHDPSGSGRKQDAQDKALADGDIHNFIMPRFNVFRLSSNSR